MSHFEFAVGMRLHFLIFAALSGVPFVSLPYASKISGFLQDLGMELPALGDFGIGQLLAWIDRSWDTRKLIGQTIAGHLPVLKQRALETNALITQVLRQRGDGSRKTYVA